LSLLKRQFEVLGLATAAGGAIDGAAELVGIPAADAKKLVPADTTTSDPNNNPLPDDNPTPEPKPQPQGGGA
jgi:hypothetical protein